jgi:hypothetical protein
VYSYRYDTFGDNALVIIHGLFIHEVCGITCPKICW